VDVAGSDSQESAIEEVSRRQPPLERALADVERYRRLAAELGSRVDDAEREAQRLREIQRAGFRAAMEQGVGFRRAMTGQRRAEVALQKAYARLALLEPLVDEMYTLIGGMEASQFWRIRNRWFNLKKRLRLHPFGAALPYPRPLIEERRVAKDPLYEQWLLANMPRATDLIRMRNAAAVLQMRPLFSVIMPTYNTPEAFLREALDSVIAQVYPHWQLCIADDASSEPHVRAVLEEYAIRDDRICVTFRSENGHISRASNSALEMARGEFIALFDHDDLLMPDALYENAVLLNARPDLDMIYSDEDKVDEMGYRTEAFFKPDWSPETFLSRNYTCHFGVYRRALITEIGGFRPAFDGSQDYDLVLRLTERTDRIAHIPRILYSWRMSAASAAGATEAKPYAAIAGRNALSEALERRGLRARIEDVDGYPGNFIVRYEIADPKRVSVVIPTRDHGEDVDRCLTSLFERTTYPNFDVLLLDNGSTDAASLATFEKWGIREPERVRVVRYDVPFNYSHINNYAVQHTSGEYVLLLNNDTEIITPDWMTGMVEQAQHAAIGVVGAKLLYADETIQHAGVILGLHGLAGHGHRLYPGTSPGYFVALQTVNNYSAVTAACLMVRRSVYDEVGGLDEVLSVAFNDVDFCLKVQKAGYRNVYLPHVVLYHLESKSRGLDNTPEKLRRQNQEHRLMEDRWKISLTEDPCYNPNLTLEDWNFAPRV
jgi:glycosyltransferase involved in cell wall biosynthesis